MSATKSRRAAATAYKPQLDSNLGNCVKWLLQGVALSAIIGAFGAWAWYENWAEKEARRVAVAEAALAYERLVSAPAGEVVQVDSAAHGRDLFIGVCAACHKPDGTGIEGLGKNLVQSDFVARLDDDKLHEFLQVGRLNAQPPMPAKGGREDLTGEDLAALVTYLRGLQDPRRMPALPDPVVVAAAPSEADKVAALEAAGGDAELAEYIAHGSVLFAASCSACHGKDARGIKGNGKDLVASTFCRGLDDDALLAFIQKGRDPSDPANTTGVGMPAKGGNPALSEDDLLDIIDYIRSLQRTQDKQLSLK